MTSLRAYCLNAFGKKGRNSSRPVRSRRTSSPHESSLVRMGRPMRSWGMVFYLTQRRRERRAGGPRAPRRRKREGRACRGRRCPVRAAESGRAALVAAADVPFEIPKGWVWCKLGGICEILGVKRKPIAKKIESPDHIHTTVQLVFKIMSQGIFLTSHWCYWAKTEQNGGKETNLHFVLMGKYG